MTVVETDRARDAAAQAKGRLAAWRDDYVDLVSALASAESPSTDPDSQAEVRGLLESELTDLGFDVERVAGDRYGDHLLARPPGGSIEQLLLGHYDTVWPLGTLETMPVKLDGERLRGPGVFDMKGGVAAGVFALRALRDIGLEPAYATGYLITAEEEIGSPESEPLIRDLAQGAERVFVLEPALGEAGLIKTRRKGVGHFRVTVHGISSHAGLAPEAGASAVHELANTIQTLIGFGDSERGVTVNVGVVTGGTRTNVVAARASADVDVRVRSGEDARRIEADFAGVVARVPGTRVEIAGAVDRDPLERTPRNQALWEQAREIGRAIGLELEEGEAGGASDGNFTSLYAATLDGLGAVGDGAHAAHEFLYVDRTLDRAALLAGLLTCP